MAMTAQAQSRPERPVIVLDNSGPGFEAEGAWNASTRDEGYYGEDYLWHAKGEGEATARWSAELPKPGLYNVYARWVMSKLDDRATNAPFTIRHREGDATVRVNMAMRQSAAAFDGQVMSEWNLLGGFEFEDAAEIVLSNDADNSVVADAVKIEYMNPPGQPLPEPGRLLFEDVCDSLVKWYAEGEGTVDIVDGRMRIVSLAHRLGVHAWFKPELPDNVIIEYDMTVHGEKGFHLFFFSAHGPAGRSILKLPPRSGAFNEYVRNPEFFGYHGSVHRRGVTEWAGGANLNKNPGKTLIQRNANDPCPPAVGDQPYRVRIVKTGRRIRYIVNDEIALDCIDDDPEFYGAGRFGFRQIYHSEISYHGVRVYEAIEPVDIGSRRELFVDKYLIEDMRGTRLKMHPPTKLPLAESPLPSGAYITVLKDGDLYRAYWRDTIPDYSGERGSGHPGEIVRYAESGDGHEWEFPNLGLHEIGGSKDNNVLLANQSPFLHNFSPFIDTRPGVDASERYKALAGHPGGWRLRGEGRGLHAFVSADGLEWRRIGEVIPYPPVTRHAFDSQNVSFWSEAEQAYVCYFRTWTGGPEQRLLRTISRATSQDFREWSELTPIEPNLPGEHLYTSQTHPYFRAPHIYVALPTRFMPARGSSTDVLFMTSRAGTTTFDRTFKEAYIRPGLDPARWGNRSNYVALNVLPTGPEEMSIWHRSGHRYALRTDGFASVNAGYEEGELLTKPLRFSGNRLEVNFSGSAAGSARVEIQGADGEPIPGYALSDCDPVVGDSISIPVSWKGSSDVSEIAGRAIRLRFVMNEADLYALRFAD